MKQSIKKQISCFIIAGSLATLTDFFIYWFLHTVVPYSLAKTISFMAGSTVAYIFNKFITFKQHKRSASEALRFCLLYLSTLVINVASNSIAILTLTKIFLEFGVPNQFIIMIAFVLATGISMILNFIGQKFWVFKYHGDLVA